MTPRDALAAALERPDGDLWARLDEAALIVASAGRIDVRPADTLSRLDALAKACPAETAAELARWLFTDAGFHGNVSDYYDPANSWLDAVVERRTGIPISLAVVMMSVGRRLGINLDGIGMPGHFLVATRTQPVEIYDPFSGGIQLTPSECENRMRLAVGSTAALHPGYLAPVGPRHILLRMINNLRQIYLARQDVPALAAVLHLRDAYSDLPPEQRLELAGVLAQLGDFAAAADVVDRVRHGAPEAMQAKLAAKASGLRARLN
ncbi:MAG: SirB1 family protein [Acidimicrobiales bacterium]